MDGDRVPATAETLAGLVRSAFGAGARLRHVSRLRGASKKGVYRVILDGGSTAIVYVWDPREDYWLTADVSTAGRDDADPFSHASGLDLFRAAHDRLSGLGIRVPREDAAAIMHLWSYVGWLMGVPERWLPRTERTGRRVLANVIAMNPAKRTDPGSERSDVPDY